MTQELEPQSRTGAPGPQAPLGPMPQPPAPNNPISGAEIVAGMLSLIWLAAVVGFYTFADSSADSEGALLKLFVIFLPLGMIWVTTLTARTIRSLRDEAARLKIAVDAMRHSYMQQQQAAASVVARPAVERKLDEIAAAARGAETAIATFATTRDRQALPRPLRAAGQGSAPDGQPALAFTADEEPQREPMTVEEYIKALNFPDSPEDKEGFRCLRLALEDRDAARLVRAAQDVLTLLAQDGIFMDDLRPDRARPEVWRRFAVGERGRVIAVLGGVRDRSSIALTTGRMRADPVFRDAAHHFLRQFDRSFAAFEKSATDQDIAELGETRTARAFMLFGRVTGVFD